VTAQLNMQRTALSLARVMGPPGCQQHGTT
jgi:hypothetical protein